MKNTASNEVILHGYAVSPGTGFGIAFLEELMREVSRTSVPAGAVDIEQDRFRTALDAVRKNVKEHVKEVHGDVEEDLGQILKAHELMLYDEDILQRIEDRIKSEQINAEWAVKTELDAIISRFENMRDPYFQARAEDVRDLGGAILKALTEGAEADADAGTGAGNGNGPGGGPRIMITKNLYPSLAMKAHTSGAGGFATESPAVYSHAAIILKGLGIPVVGSVEGLLDAVKKGDEIIVDGLKGIVIINPEAGTKESYTKQRKVEKLALEKAPAYAAAYTQDEIQINLTANIEHPNQVPLVFQSGLNGIGLFRTEFLALSRGAVPGEQEQIAVYRELVSRMGENTITIRTLDIGADKSTTSLHSCTGMNPALGIRGIRRHIAHEPEELKTQIRAILQAAVGGSVRILFPLITTTEDLERAKEQFYTAVDELDREGVPFSRDVQLGAMIEIPAAAISTGEILTEADFISIGTNDLLQYFTAADRNNPAVLSYYNPHTDAFTWLLGFIIGEAEKADRVRDVTVCGELAGDVDFLPTLLRLGYRSLSISPAAAEKIRTAAAQIRIN